MTDRSYGVGLTTSAWEKRKKQLANWEASETNREPSYLRTKSRVKFSKDVMFLAAVGSGDEEEVDRLLTDEKVDINCRNNDGMTAVHQCCIDDDLAMLKVVIKQGGDINGLDNEGWTPLHAAASCGYSHIVKYLLECGAFPASLNNDGQTPSDLAEDYDEVVQLLQAEINRLGIDIDDLKCEEERQMLEDAKKLRNNPDLDPVISPGGATPLHVAAAKNYTTVLNVLLSIKGLDINIRDDDGWTPLHAAVHWESMEAAELLIFNGANVYAKTDAGEELDDLIDPDLEDELKELKKLNSYINPEQEHIRKRRPQVARRSSSSLTHSNSFDNKHGIITRRLSKEKLTMIDMKKEKEDLMHSFEKFDEDDTVPLSNAPPLSNTPPLSNSTTAHNDTNINNKVGVSTSTNQTPPPLLHSHSSGSLTGSNSPKNNRRKGEMSKNMLDRLNVFEVSGPSSSPSVSSPRTSTPVCSPPVNANGGSSSSERKKVDSSDVPRGRVNSMDQTSTGITTNTAASTTAKNRFSFQPKPVSGNPPLTTSSKTMSLDRGSEHLFHEAAAAYNNTPSRSMGSTSSSSSSSSSSSTLRTIVESKGSKKADMPTSATTTPATATPTNTPVSATPIQATPTSTSTPVQTGSGDTSSGNLSTDSSKDRTGSFAVSQPETKRRTVAKNKRESRRATQPLPADLLERISKHDQMEEQKTEQVTPTSATPTSATPTSATPSKLTSTNSADISVTAPTPPLPTTPTPPLTTPTTIQPTTPNVSQMATPTGGGNESSTSNLSPQQIPRSKSSNRRKHKEKRRSTGITTEVDSDCEIPDNLKGIISHSRSGSGDSSDGGLTNNITDVQGTELESSLSASTIEYYQQEMATLKKLLQDEKKKNETIVCTYQQTYAKLEAKESEFSDLQKKYNETVLMLEKERADKEQKEKRIIQLEKSQKGIQELKAEIQRLKDENGALIRVVGKLSRAPITT